MSRRPPSDTFTRFTSTTPHAAQPSTFTSRSPPNASSTPPSQRPPQRSAFPSGPEGETPAQKVERLRRMNRQAKEAASLSATDRLIARGRFWADAAHRITTYGLLAFTGISSVVAVYGIVSLISHNRRQKRAWIEREIDRLYQAQQAFLRGEADAEQLHLLEQERAGEEIARKYADEKVKKKEQGVFGSIKGTFGTFMGSGDKGVEDPRATEVAESVKSFNAEGRDRLLSEGWVEDGSTGMKPVAVQESNIAGVGLDEKGRPVPLSKLQKVSSKFESERRTGEKQVAATTGIRAGPLDVLAGNIAGSISPSSQNGSGGSWLGWLTSPFGAGGGSSSSASPSTS